MTMSDRIAVMRHGRIEQIGEPEELYERPRTDFVAGFLGVSNLLDGDVAGRSGEHAEIRLGDGRIVRVPAAAIDGASQVRIGIRPEKLRVIARGDESHAPEADLNWIDGEILDASYIGVSTQYLVRTGDGHTLTVYAQNLDTGGASEVLSDGQPVRLTWRPHHTFVIEQASSTEQGDQMEEAIE